MNLIKQKLQFLYRRHGKNFTPATEDELISFENEAKDNNVPSAVISELKNFYQVTNGVPCFDSFDFHSCNDKILYEWWEDYKELWLGGRDCDVIRWSKSINKFCLGDGGTVSYGKEYEFPTLAELLEFAFNDWGLN